ncbi:protease complex subunit PrcB family protein [Salinisphaera orenii]|uniref:protease complex subunit PrcB family protein n=1 Tax=Salinisphaera orenii TaxID=856731 RepID=UPI00161ED171|nr:protease complex subunit PrcB family protein [Salinisphaera orenii]
MTRMLLCGVALTLLAACSLNPFQRGDSLRVLEESRYCGTPSQDSDAVFFGDSARFGDWIAYRSIEEFDADLAADRGVLVVEMGQRPTGGYGIDLDRDKTAIEDDTLTIGMTWSAPRLDAAVSQALVAPCVVLRLPQGDYTDVRVVDQLGDVRGTATID